MFPFDNVIIYLHHISVENNKKNIYTPMFTKKKEQTANLTLILFHDTHYNDNLFFSTTQDFIIMSLNELRNVN